ncbi:hypothetical protein [Thalassotalea crassostreae]|uniref:Kelch repeat-containing protein n=1 Tax=Thalassotalea crassostreae TaxID=1763536 RepID=UPI000839A91A|nr:hypothetical protein [Thalassotalea crassostreae]
MQNLLTYLVMFLLYFASSFINVSEANTTSKYLQKYRSNDFSLFHNSPKASVYRWKHSYREKHWRNRFKKFSKSLNDATWQQIQYKTEWAERAGLQVVNLRGKFYLMGGRKPLLNPRFNNESTLFNDVWVSGNKGSTWRKLLDSDENSHWPARAYFKVVTKGQYMYVIGGQNFKPVCVAPNPVPQGFPECFAYQPQSEFFNDVWRSKNGKNWKRMTANAPWVGRAGLMAEVLGNRIYVFGGSKNDDSAVVQGAPARIYYNDVWSSKDGKHWRKETAEAKWSKRAGGATLVKNGFIYLLGGEFGFLPDEQGNLPYLNDVWRTRNGSKWQRVTAAAQWSPRPGHQCEVIYNKMVCFGGFGLPFNPTQVWQSRTGKKWTPLSIGAWGALTDFDSLPFASEAIKYDFDVVRDTNWRTGEQSIYTFGGDREVFFTPFCPQQCEFGDTECNQELLQCVATFNFDRVENDVWKFGF